MLIFHCFLRHNILISLSSNVGILIYLFKSRTIPVTHIENYCLFYVDISKVFVMLQICRVHTQTEMKTIQRAKVYREVTSSPSGKLGLNYNIHI